MKQANSYRVNRTKWARLSFEDQMGNISSEIGRSFIYLRKNDQKMAEAAMVRAIDLLEATSETLIRLHSPKLKEVLRAKEEYLQAFYDGKDQEGIEKYFNQFAIASRLNH